MSKLYVVLLLSLMLLLLTGCGEGQANLGDQLLLSSQQNQSDFWSEYPENFETEVASPRMFAKNTK
jgi:hypothetical protein